MDKRFQRWHNAVDRRGSIVLLRSVRSDVAEGQIEGNRMANKTERMVVRLTPTIATKLARLATQLEVSKAEVIRRLIERAAPEEISLTRDQS